MPTRGKFRRPNIKFGPSLFDSHFLNKHFVTTSTKEISTAKSEIVALPQKHDLHF